MDFNLFLLRWGNCPPGGNITWLNPQPCQAQMPGLPAFQWGQNVLCGRSLRKVSPEDQTHSSPRRDPRSPSGRKGESAKTKQAASLLRHRKWQQPGLWARQVKQPASTLTHFGSGRLGSFSMVIFFASSGSSLFANCLRPSFSKWAICYHGIWCPWTGSVHRALTAHLFLLPGLTLHLLSVPQLLMFFIWDLEITSHLWRSKQRRVVFSRPLYSKENFFTKSNSIKLWVYLTSFSFCDT